MYFSYAASAAPTAHPEAATTEECTTARERSAGGSFWTHCTPDRSTWTYTWFCHNTPLAPGGLHCSSSRPVWTSPASLSRHSEACRDSRAFGPKVLWRFPRGATEGLQPQRVSLPQAEPPWRCGSPRTSSEVRASEPAPDLI